MREFSTPLTVAVPATGNLTDDVVRNAAEEPDAVVVLAPAARLGGVARRHRRGVPRPRCATSPRDWSPPASRRATGWR